MGGVLVVVSGGVVVVVVSAGVVVIVESIVVLSDDPAMFFDELHADVAAISEPATARLKIIFFIVLYCYLNFTTTLLIFSFDYQVNAQKLISIVFSRFKESIS